MITATTHPHPSQPPLGVIEGFFGRSWSWAERADYAKFLADAGYHFYIYAPKSDRYLRKAWQEDWPSRDFHHLLTLRDNYRTQSVHFGIGLSPFEVYRQESQHQRDLLRKKIQRVNELQPDIFCLLFDDMRGDLPNLAALQCDLVHLAADECNAKHIIFCPTYYSFDPVLEKVFGQRPENYWQSLGQTLDPKIDIFWTGPKVCSTEYPPEHLQIVTELLQRKPFLWDNYPVNDGALRSQHLYLRGFNEGHKHLVDTVSGHGANPMNQPWLSRLPLLSLPRAYHGDPNYSPDGAFAEICHQIFAADFAAQLIEDVTLLEDIGLQKLAGDDKSRLFQRYQAWAATNPYADEICQWLNGGYGFDPGCLTE